ncbi:MAG: PspC domain-containing protein [Steroidobacteraceae bacterium]|nr:PspC domain-containing protein [Steroidobacteraceae bacterium]
MRRISVTVSLNRSTLQFDEAAYARLENYLAESASLLEGDPDPQEILGDLEQAVADQCARRLGPGQTLVTLAELVPALEEIGSVQTPSSSVSPEQSPRETSRPLQQISEGAVISGVCQGLARYFGLNVMALRIFAVLLLLVTGGGVILVYLALMVLFPYAPLQPGGRPLGWLPAKSRALVEFLRTKLSLATN